MKGQVLADFIVDHNIDLDCDESTLCEGQWEMYFDGSVCMKGQGIGCFIVSPSGIEHEVSIRLEFECPNN
jgi:hypothetical protein